LRIQIRISGANPVNVVVVAESKFAVSMPSSGETAWQDALSTAVVEWLNGRIANGSLRIPPMVLSGPKGVILLTSRARFSTITCQCGTTRNGDYAVRSEQNTHCASDWA